MFCAVEVSSTESFIEVPHVISRYSSTILGSAGEIVLINLYIAQCRHIVYIALNGDLFADKPSLNGTIQKVEC